MCAMDLLICNSGSSNSESQFENLAPDSDAELSHVTLNSDGLISDGSPNSDGLICDGSPNSDGLISYGSPSSDVLFCNGEPDAEYQTNKRRRKSSQVWEYFTVQAVDANHQRAVCNQCRRSYSYINGKKSMGTSHLKRHINSAVCPAGRNFLEKQLPGWTPEPKINGSPNVTNNPKKRGRPAQNSATINRCESHDNITDQPKKRKKASRNCPTSYFDEECCSYDIAKMIIQHGYPLEMVAHSGFNKFVSSLQPQYKPGSVSTIEERIVGIYLREKHNVLSLLAGIPGRVNLMLDSWSSDQSTCYVILTAQFIDSDWKLHRRILNATILPFPDTEDAYNHAIASCLTEWNIDTKLFALTLNQYVHGETIRGNLRGFLSIKNPSILNGQLVMGSCYAGALSGVAQEALELMKETVERVRQDVKYVTASEINRLNFAQIRQQLQVPSTRVLDFDDKTKWNTTYEMLMAARDLKEVFSCLDTLDPEYKVSISAEEWRQVETLCMYLKLLYDAASILTAGAIPTANIFFHDVWKIQSELMLGAVSPDPFVCNLTRPLYEKFDKYWQDCGLISAVAVIMDPRFKMKLIEFSIPRIYGQEAESWAKVIDEGLHELFLDYVVQSLPAPNFIENANESDLRPELSQEDGLLPVGDFFSDFDIYISSGFVSGPQLKSELDQYLEEPLLPRVQSFDVLGWWKDNVFRYPTLSKMASDILSISFSTVHDRDSVFDTSKKHVERNWRNLTPTTVEALVSAKDWLEYDSGYSISI